MIFRSYPYATEIPHGSRDASILTFHFRHDFIVPGPFIEAGEHFPCFARNDSRFVIFACKLPYGIQRIKCHDSDKLHFFSCFATKQLNTSEAVNVAGSDPGEDFSFQHFLIPVRVAAGGPSMPDSAYHAFSPFPSKSNRCAVPLRRDLCTH
jgi:hypothetical protein